jgi:pyridinium-3,5-bisthiocarboxylic acid mononucleotide nickel chelatase
MRVAYLDCATGISGDMLLGALIDVGWPEQRLRELIGKLKIGDVQIRVDRVSKRGVAATQVNILSSPHQPHRGLHDLTTIVLNADLSPSIQQRAMAALQLLAEAESHVHGVPVDRIHFHEVGAVDTIVDIVGALAGFSELKIEGVHSSALPWSRGTVKTEHGVLPVPPPAVALLLRDVPVVGVDIEGETVTPTGAVLVRTITKQFGTMPAMTVERVGYGAGQRDWPDRPNVLRLTIGESSNSAGLHVEQLSVLSCNIDDMNPQWYQPVIKELNEAGALDVWLTPVQMKKNRPGVLLSVLCGRDEKEALLKLLFTETTTLGVRSYEVERRALRRSMARVETQYGPIDVKVAHLNGSVVNEMPEFEQCRAAAVKTGVPVKVVEDAARTALKK